MLQLGCNVTCLGKGRGRCTEAPQLLLLKPGRAVAPVQNRQGRLATDLRLMQPCRAGAMVHFVPRCLVLY